MTEYQEFLAMRSKVYDLINKYEQKAYYIAIIVSNGYIPRATDYTVGFTANTIYFQWTISYHGEETDVGEVIKISPELFSKSLEELKSEAEHLIEELRKREFELAQLAKKHGLQVTTQRLL